MSKSHLTTWLKTFYPKKKNFSMKTENCCERYKIKTYGNILTIKISKSKLPVLPVSEVIIMSEKSWTDFK